MFAALPRLASAPGLPKLITCLPCGNSWIGHASGGCLFVLALWTYNIKAYATVQHELLQGRGNVLVFTGECSRPSSLIMLLELSL